MWYPVNSFGLMRNLKSSPSGIISGSDIFPIGIYSLFAIQYPLTNDLSNSPRILDCRFNIIKLVQLEAIMIKFRFYIGLLGCAYASYYRCCWYSQKYNSQAPTNTSGVQLMIIIKSRLCLQTSGLVRSANMMI